MPIPQIVLLPFIPITPAQRVPCENFRPPTCSGSGALSSSCKSNPNDGSYKLCANKISTYHISTIPSLKTYVIIDQIEMVSLNTIVDHNNFNIIAKEMIFQPNRYQVQITWRFIKIIPAILLVEEREERK